MTERNYYTEFKKHIGEPKQTYFNFLNENDWEDFFDDYYRHDLYYLIRIFDIPKGETIHSYALIYLKDVTGHIRNLIIKANNSLFIRYRREDKVALFDDFFNTVAYLKLSIDLGSIVSFIECKNYSNQLREKAAFTLISVHDNALNSFWDKINLEIDSFLIPSYLAFYSNKNPLLGFKKLLALNNEPSDLIPYETPILYSLLQIATSPSDIENFKKIKAQFPYWLTDFINEIFEEYTELSALEAALRNPYENILKEIGLDTEILEDSTVPQDMRDSLLNLLVKIKRKPSLKRIVKEEQISLIDPTYIDSLDEIVEKLKEKLTSMQFGDFNDPPNEEVFEVTEKKIYYRLPTLFLYPYFLDETRIEELGAGVIPYGKQTCMALIINKKNKKYREWELLRAEAEIDLPKVDDIAKRNYEADRAISNEKSTAWLKSLIESIYRAKDGEIYTVTGYVFNSIIQQFAEDNIKDNKKLGEVLFSINVDSIKDKLPYYKDDLKGSAKVNLDQILLLDPADALGISKNGNRVFKKLNDEFAMLIVQHGLNIKVGIGYSLFALPCLLQNNNWKILQDFMIENLKAVDRLTFKSQEKTLNSIGITLLDNTYQHQYKTIQS